MPATSASDGDATDMSGPLGPTEPAALAAHNREHCRRTGDRPTTRTGREALQLAALDTHAAPRFLRLFYGIAVRRQDGFPFTSAATGTSAALFTSGRYATTERTHTLPPPRGLRQSMRRLAPTGPTRRQARAVQPALRRMAPSTDARSGAERHLSAERSEHAARSGLAEHA